MTAAEIYATRIDAVHAQRARLHGAPPPSDPWEGPVARRFRADPHVTVQVVKTGITPPRATSDRLRAAETEPLHPAGRLHMRR